MKALVTGASGFIGSTLIEELTNLGFDVTALMRRTSSPSNLEGLKYERVEGDLSDYDSLCRAVKGVDYVFHLAGLTVAKNRKTYFEFNAGGTERLAKAVAEHRPGLKRFVYVSSLAAGGPAQHEKPRTETDSDHPVSAYGAAKLKGEQELLKFKDLYPVSIIRPPMVYGPKDKATFIFIQTISRNLMPLFKGLSHDGHKHYSMVHVRDLCRGIVQAGVATPAKVPSGEIFYLCSDDIVTYEALMTTIAERLNREPLKIRIPSFVLKAMAVGMHGLGKVSGRTFPLNLDKLNELLPDYWTCSNAKARELLGFKPEFTLATGMADAIDWYQARKWI
ncbi:MAG: NAD-dependent epimerase/dehydratase family protein [Methylotenera sp.]|nr:NAD-dependent epimerase/dehydratase family protein [Oligoflexia bacterium]